MRRVYLIRHAHPDFPAGAHVCLGRTDMPLGTLGKMQGCLLGESFCGTALSTVFSSPLRRCLQTAAALGMTAVPVPELAEQNMGVWDGLDFDEIRSGWPELYERRKDEPLLVPPGAETLGEVQTRVLPAFHRCLRESEGDIAIVAHASVVQAILAELCAVPLAESRKLRPDYTGCALLLDDGERTEAVKLNRLPEIPLTPELAEKLLQRAEIGERIVRHSRAVAKEALRIAEALPLKLDIGLLESAALLHDAARTEKNHAVLGARWLRMLGFDEAAAVTERHHDHDGETLDETAILYIADKVIQEDRQVSLHERFEASLEKCGTDEARAAHERRLQAAKKIQTKCNQLCGYELIR
ncbi:MAG: histidine phosphatase family protein [Oscillospiraceae bacterium]|nr:histidine phosphatase family protein [Oscillospiraceae bacterium]